MKLPSYEDCVKVTQHNDMFIEKKIVVQGQEVSIFNYIVADIRDFAAPFESSEDESLKNSGIDAYEMRGLTFVKSASGQWKRYLALPKFFNVNQNEANQLSKIRHLKILRSQTKADGSMIHFVEFENGLILPKTKMSFETDQAIKAQEVLQKNKKLEAFVREVLSRGHFPIFEMVSPLNKIVVDYDKTKLQLLQIRDENGDLQDIYNYDLVKQYQVETTSQEPVYDWDYYMEARETAENTEGWIVLAEDGVLRKIKTQWYMARHHIVTEALVRENDIVVLVLNETLDDALSMIPEADVRRQYALDIERAMATYLAEQVRLCTEILQTSNGIPKDYAIAYRQSNYRLFHLTVKLLPFKDSPELAELLLARLKEEVLEKKAMRLMEARAFVKDELKVQIKEIQVDDGDN